MLLKFKQLLWLGHEGNIKPTIFIFDFGHFLFKLDDSVSKILNFLLLCHFSHKVLLFLVQQKIIHSSYVTFQFSGDFNNLSFVLCFQFLHFLVVFNIDSVQCVLMLSLEFENCILMLHFLFFRLIFIKSYQPKFLLFCVLFNFLDLEFIHLLQLISHILRLQYFDLWLELACNVLDFSLVFLPHGLLFFIVFLDELLDACLSLGSLFFHLILQFLEHRLVIFLSSLKLLIVLIL